MLRILLLGTPVISQDDTPLKITRKLQRALLFYLAERGGPVGREELVGMLWPEESEEDARRRLSQALARLRAGLPDRSLLMISVSQVCLDFKKVYVDVGEFRNLLRQAGNLPWQLPGHSALPEDIVQILTNAMRLWRSSHFMAGYDTPNNSALENWYIDTHQELELLRQRLAERLADHAMARGDLETTLNWLLSAIQNDEMDEGLNSRVLNLMIDMGRRSAAISFFNHLKELYEQDGDPSLPQAILKAFNRISLASDIVGLPGWPVTTSYQFPLVGRAAVLRDLRTTYNRGGTVILQGEAGVGKTRLVQEFFYTLAPAPRLLLAAAHPTEGRLPFQVIIEMLRRYITAEDWKKLPPAWGRPIAALLPELQMMRPEFGSLTAQDGTEHALLFEAIRQVLLQVAQQQRLFVFLDDAQWADESSLLALAFLLQHGFFDTHGLLVIAARIEEQNPQLQTVLDLARRFTSCHDLYLPLLAKEEISELATFALGQPATDALVERLAKDTGGNPLFILMTIRSLLDMQVDPKVMQPSDALPLASGIHALLRERLRGVNLQTRQAALVAAVIGSTFELDVLENASQMPEEVVTQAVEEMENLRLVYAMDTQAQQRLVYSFVHDMIREALLLELSQARRHLLHRRVAQALQVTLGGRAMQQAAVLAQHYELAGDFSSAFDWWLQAAQRARQLFSLSEAETAFKRAEQLLQTLDGGINDERVYHLYARWGEMIYEAHGVEALNRVYSTLLHLGEERESPLLIGTALSGLCNAAILVLDLEKALDCANQALTYLAQTGNLLELAHAHNRRGTVLGLSDRYLEARTAFEQSLAIISACPQSDCMHARSTSQYYIALFMYLTGWPEQAIAYVENAMHETSLLQQPYHRMCFYGELIMANVSAGNYRAAQEYVQKGLELAQKLQSWRLLTYILAHAAQNELALGNLDASLDYAYQAMQLGQSYDPPGAVPRAYAGIGDIFHALGVYDLAAEAYQKGLAGSAESHKKMDVTYRLGCVLGMTGQVERGMAILTQVITQAEAAGLESISIPARVHLARLYFATGEKEKARQEALYAIQQGHERSIYLSPPYASLVLGQIALTEGDAQAAKDYARSMIDQPKRPGNVILEINGLVLLLQALRLEQHSDPQAWQRLIQRLDEVEAHAQHPEIAPYFRIYREKLLASLQA